MPLTHITIDSRFNGPPSSANGGYTCGILARLIDGVAEVTLRSPPPLDHDLQLRTESDIVLLCDGDRLVAEGHSSKLPLDLPPPISFENAQRASRSYSGFDHHVFPTCFVCGPRRDAGDGLRIFPGRVNGPESPVAAPWIPGRELADATGAVPDEYVWAALDCPGAFAIGLPDDRTLVLGRMIGVVDRPVRAGERYVVSAWALGGEGRKFFAGSSVCDEHGVVHAHASATWIEIG